jgi:hypothetical protein
VKLSLWTRIGGGGGGGRRRPGTPPTAPAPPQLPPRLRLFEGSNVPPRPPAADPGVDFLRAIRNSLPPPPLRFATPAAPTAQAAPARQSCHTTHVPTRVMQKSPGLVCIHHPFDIQGLIPSLIFIPLLPIGSPIVGWADAFCRPLGKATKSVRKSLRVRMGGCSTHPIDGPL